MANYGDIPSIITLAAGESVRRNAVNTAFEAYFPVNTAATIAALGVVQLDTAPVDPLIPIAVGSNNVVFTAIQKRKYFASFATVALAKANHVEAGSPPTEWVATQNCSVSANETLPVTMLITCEGDGKFTVASGFTLTIGLWSTPADTKQYFFGLGKVVLAQNAVAEMQLEWWAGTSNAGDCSHAFDQLNLSLDNQTGGIARIGPGTWRTNPLTRRNYSSYIGAGMYATTIQIFNTASTGGIFEVGNGFRWVRTQDLTLSVGASPTAQCVKADGTTISGFDLIFDRVRFTGSASDAVAQINIAPAGASVGWEIIGMQFRDCLSETGARTSSFKCQTINSNLTISNWTIINGAGGVGLDLRSIGYVASHNIDFRGINPAPGTTPTTANRTVTATTVNLSNIVNLTAGSFTQSDVGQKFTLTGAINGNITQLNSATQAVIDVNATASTTAVATVSWYGTHITSPLAAIRISGDHGPLQFNMQEEGFQYALINEASTAAHPITINSSLIQTHIWLKEACALNLHDNSMFSNCLIDNVGVLSYVDATANSVSINTVQGVTLTKSKLWGPRSGSSVVFHESGYRQNNWNQLFNFAASFKRFTTEYEDRAVAEFGSVDDNVPGPPYKPTIRIGRINRATENFEHYYDLFRHPVTGYLAFRGSQESFRGYDFDSEITSPYAKFIDLGAFDTTRAVLQIGSKWDQAGGPYKPYIQLGRTNSSGVFDVSYQLYRDGADGYLGFRGTQTAPNRGYRFDAPIEATSFTVGTWEGAAIGITKGGTGQITANAAFNALAPSQATHSGKFLTTNGADASWAAIAGAGDMILASVQTVTGTKTFGTIGGAVGKFILAGSTSGSTIINAAAVAGTTTITLPGTTGTVLLTDGSAAALTSFPTLNQSTTGSAATLTTPRAIYGNNFDGSTALAQIITSVYGGTGSGFTKFSGPATTEKIFTLPNASATILTGNAAITILQGGTGATTAANARTNLGIAEEIKNYSIEIQEPVDETRTYIIGSAIAVPVNKLKVGTCFRWTFNITKTATGIAASTFTIAVGTAGTTADTNRVSFTKPAGTAVADEGVVTIMATVRSIGATGVMVGEFSLIHNLASTGHAVIPCVCLNTISAGFDMTVANLIVGLTVTPGTSDAITIQIVQAEAWNL